MPQEAKKTPRSRSTQPSGKAVEQPKGMWARFKENVKEAFSFYQSLIMGYGLVEEVKEYRRRTYVRDAETQTKIHIKKEPVIAKNPHYKSQEAVSSKQTKRPVKEESIVVNNPTYRKEKFVTSQQNETPIKRSVVRDNPRYTGGVVTSKQPVMPMTEELIIVDNPLYRSEEERGIVHDNTTQYGRMKSESISALAAYHQQNHNIPYEQRSFHPVPGKEKPTSFGFIVDKHNVIQSYDPEASFMIKRNGHQNSLGERLYAENKSLQGAVVKAVKDPNRDHWNHNPIAIQEALKVKQTIDIQLDIPGLPPVNIRGAKKECPSMYLESNAFAEELQHKWSQEMAERKGRNR